MRLRGSRRTNLALAVVVPAALLTGALAFATGASWVGWIAGAHATMGLTLVIVSPWKTAIARHGMRRRPGPRSWPSIGLGVSIVVTVATGLLHSTGLARTLGPVTAMQAHVAMAVASIPLFVWHLGARPIAHRRTDLSRRAVLGAGMLGGASLASYGAVAMITNALSLRGADRRGTGSYEFASFDPGRMPVTQWLNDAVPAPDPSRSLDVLTPDGARRWSLDELARFDDNVRAVLDCTGGCTRRRNGRGSSCRACSLATTKREASSSGRRPVTPAGSPRRTPATCSSRSGSAGRRSRSGTAHRCGSSRPATAGSGGSSG